MTIVNAKNYDVVDFDEKFKLCVVGEPYKMFAGMIKNKKTGEIFEGSITLYKFLCPDGTWKINESEDIYCLADEEEFCETIY